MTEASEEKGNITFRRRSGYTAIPNHILSDRRLKMEERGFLCLIMSFSEGWIFRRAHLLEVTGWGKDKYYSVLNRLEEVGYITKSQTKDEGGTFGASSWDIHDSPPQDDVPPCPANPDTVENVTPELQECTVSGSAGYGSAGYGSAGYGESGHIRNNNSKNTNNKKINHKGDDDFSFEDFWGIHPKPVNEIETEREWVKARDAGTDMAWVMFSARKYRMECLGKSKQYIKASHAWLSDRRWTDYKHVTTERFVSADEKKSALYDRIEKRIRDRERLNPVLFTKDLVSEMIVRGALTEDEARREGYI